MKLNDLKDEFNAINIGIVSITYDDTEVIKAFDEKWSIEFPILQDVDRMHVDAWGVRNLEYGPGTFAYGVPLPGVVLISPEGKILAKWAEEGYRSRADWSEVLEQVAATVGGR